jgi:hypothetical protein
VPNSRRRAVELVPLDLTFEKNLVFVSLEFMRIVDYKTAHGASVKELDNNVNGMIREGFQPFGNAYVSDQEVEGIVDTFAVWQPMVRYGE